MALEIARNPALARRLHRAVLPDGMTFLLEVAANDVAALADAEARTHQSPQTLRAAANFFVEQVMLADRNADSYRLIGCRPDAPYPQMRRHMALLMTWLHPDAVSTNGQEQPIDRSVFANRITKAWEDLKTEDRRRHYDRQLHRAGNGIGKRHGAHASKAKGKRHKHASRRKTSLPIVSRLHVLLSALRQDRLR